MRAEVIRLDARRPSQKAIMPPSSGNFTADMIGLYLDLPPDKQRRAREYVYTLVIEHEEGDKK